MNREKEGMYTFLQFVALIFITTATLVSTKWTFDILLLLFVIWAVWVLRTGMTAAILYQAEAKEAADTLDNPEERFLITFAYSLQSAKMLHRIATNRRGEPNWFRKAGIYLFDKQTQRWYGPFEDRVEAQEQQEDILYPPKGKQFS